VMEPRKEYRGGQEESPQGRMEGKADGFPWPEGSRPGREMASAQDPTGSERGAGLHRGSSGTWESHLSPGDMSGWGDRRIKGPGVVGALRPNHEPARDTTNTQTPARYRGASDQRRASRGAGWQS
jgi:hypothetical protein